MNPVDTALLIFHAELKGALDVLDKIDEQLDWHMESSIPCDDNCMKMLKEKTDRMRSGLKEAHMHWKMRKREL